MRVGRQPLRPGSWQARWRRRVLDGGRNIAMSSPPLGRAIRVLLQTLHDLPARLLLGAVRAYRFFLKPWLGNACRFEPTCSAYALQAIGQHGAAAGAGLTAGRLLRCHPWCQGGLDPVPADRPRLFSRLFTRFSSKTRP